MNIFKDGLIKMKQSLYSRIIHITFARAVTNNG
ncbi:hypothetical protein Calag_1504 [Caldisphaera lagunensis DSM 15908]|uniref:Uncharacterized protein n=1 Tax=Caldisphaera lagunensis (strain DSM 15908 / JCM 11604 / ANMR 0165 / IC-154) TaxID=1056495 RepID=L0ADT4_CALLD|nr:hypothetical protein Calag_1504 [Caldisphaera lagunensis DSM 15908]